MSELHQLLQAAEAEIERFVEMTEGMSDENRARIVVGWLGLDQARKMNDFLEQNP